jgi:hypothetical protein
MNNKPIIFDFLEHLRVHKEPLILRHNGTLPQWGDESLHREIYDRTPELYALSSVIQTVQTSQRDRMLFQLLQRSRQGLHPDVRCTLDSVINFLLTILHPDKVLTVFLALKRVRANHKHTTKAILKYIFQHPHSLDMAICRRPAVVDCLEHALGKNVARACAKIIKSGSDETYLRRHLLRFVSDKEQAKLVLQLLYRQEVRQTSKGQYQELHTKYTQILESHQERPKTVTATNRGDIAATLVHLYRGGKSHQLLEATKRYVKDTAVNLPIFDGQLALVFDASASTRSYGDREFCCLAQSVALKLVLEQCCTNLKVYQVGGSYDLLPMPVGETDLATAVIDALKGEPDLVAVVSDGYENVYPGDLQRLVASLPQIGVQTPVIFCHSKFTNLDDLELRRPANNLTQLEFWHQDDFEDLLISLFSIAGNKGEASLREFLMQKLSQIEKELQQLT